MTLQNQKQVKISDLIAPSFHDIYRDIHEGNHSQYWLKGGRGSTKSSFVALNIILLLIKDPLANAFVYRKTGNSIRTSVQNNLLWAIDKLGLNQYFKNTYSPHELTYLPTKQKIIMSGCDDPLKLKSIKTERGYFKIMWGEELAGMSGMEEVRSLQQSVLRGGEKFIEFITYNPPRDPNHWINKEDKQGHPERYVHHSTYQDIPPEWLGNRFLTDVESLKKNNYDAYRNEYLGEVVGNVESLVFNGKWEEMEFETPNTNDIYQSKFFYGADWGFANDPTTIVRCFIKGDDLYIDYEAGGIGIELEDIPKLFDKIPQSRKWRIYGDCARPETISYVARRGFNLKPAKKWKDSIEEGITYLRSFGKIYIHPRCKETIQEFQRYSYKIDKNTNEILPVVNDCYNHYVDAIRYALCDYITKKVSILDVL